MCVFFIAVGFTFSHLTFDPEDAGMPTAVTFIMTPSTILLVGEQIKLKLYEFTGPTTGTTLYANSTFNADFYWSSNTSSIVITPLENVTAAQHTLVFYKSNGLTIPSSGVTVRTIIYRFGCMYCLLSTSIIY